jgi:predicted transcriptional regulator
MRSGKSYLTRWQWRALEATARGEVKRSGTTLTCPTINSATLRFLLNANFITNGPREGDVTTMILTKKGERFLAAPEHDHLVALAKASFWRWGGIEPKLTPAQQRGLEATQRGMVTRTCTARNKFICPTVGARALWCLLDAGLIANGPKNGDRIHMILTSKGEAAIAPGIRAHRPEV